MNKAQTETVLRMAITGLEQADARLKSLDDFHRMHGQRDNEELPIARRRITATIKNIHVWAKANRFEITESMKT